MTTHEGEGGEFAFFLRLLTSVLKWSGSFHKTNIFIVDLTLVSPKKYFAKNLKFCLSRNLLFSTAASATKLL